MEAFKTAWLKRRAQFSTVAFLKSSDPKRLPQFIKYIDAVYRSSGKPYTIYLYKVGGGLYKVYVDAETGEINYTRVASTRGQPIRSLEKALVYMDSIIEREERVILIFWGLFPYHRSISGMEYYFLIKFLRNIIFTDDYYSSYVFVTIFTECPSCIVDEDTLKHSILVDVTPSTPEERRQILKKIADQLGVKVKKKELENMVAALKGLNLHELESVALESIFKYKTLDLRAMTEYKYDLIRKTGLLDVEDSPLGFEAIGGYKTLKDFVKQNIINILRNPGRARALGIEPPRGVLLFGPPGTGKTVFAKALAKEIQLPFLRLRTENIVSKFYGETSRLMAKALRTAEDVAPAILFVDEIDRFGRRGQPGEHEESRKAFSILLEWLGDEKRQTIVVGTTNRPEDLDEAFRRVGRFDYIIPMLYPDFEARLEILKVHTSIRRKVPLAQDVDLEKIATQTPMWSGAELEELVKRAARRALTDGSNKVTMQHFRAALKSFRINQQERLDMLNRYMKLAAEFTNDAEFLMTLEKTYSTDSIIKP